MPFSLLDELRISDTVVHVERRLRNDRSRRRRWVNHPAGETSRHFELYDILVPGESSDAYPRTWDSENEQYDTDTAAETFTVYDALKRFRGRKRDDTVSAEEDSGGTRGKHGSQGVAILRNGRWEIEYLQPHATLIICRVTQASFSAASATVTVDNVQVIQPIETALLMADVESLENVWNWAGFNNQRVKADWNDAAENWEMAMKICDP